MEANKYEIAVQDACILIDLIDLDLITDFFQLDISVYTTPQVVNEIILEEQRVMIAKYISNGKLQVDANGMIGEILTLSEEHPALSFADSSVLELALRKEAIIFSSDGSLRKISIQKDLEVRGSLWVIKELYNQEIITLEAAIEKLDIYPVINKRAPIRQINNLIDMLRALK